MQDGCCLLLNKERYASQHESIRVFDDSIFTTSDSPSAASCAEQPMSSEDSLPTFTSHRSAAAYDPVQPIHLLAPMTALQREPPFKTLRLTPAFDAKQPLDLWLDSWLVELRIVRSEIAHASQDARLDSVKSARQLSIWVSSCTCHGNISC